MAKITKLTAPINTHSKTALQTISNESLLGFYKRSLVTHDYIGTTATSHIKITYEALLVISGFNRIPKALEFYLDIIQYRGARYTLDSKAYTIKHLDDSRFIEYNWKKLFSTKSNYNRTKRQFLDSGLLYELEDGRLYVSPAYVHCGQPSTISKLFSIIRATINKTKKRLVR